MAGYRTDPSVFLKEAGMSKEYKLTKFEVAMGQIFHQLFGSDTRPIYAQDWWEDIQKLKKLAEED